jgi:hypothetical protein
VALHGGVSAVQRHVLAQGTMPRNGLRQEYYLYVEDDEKAS